MPSQNVHDATCLITAELLATCGIVQGPRAFQMAAGAALEVFVHPDWDYAEIRGSSIALSHHHDQGNQKPIDLTK